MSDIYYNIRRKYGIRKIYQMRKNCYACKFRTTNIALSERFLQPIISAVKHIEIGYLHSVIFHVHAPKSGKRGNNSPAFSSVLPLAVMPNSFTV